MITETDYFYVTIENYKIIYGNVMNIGHTIFEWDCTFDEFLTKENEVRDRILKVFGASIVHQIEVVIDEIREN